MTDEQYSDDLLKRFGVWSMRTIFVVAILMFLHMTLEDTLDFYVENKKVGLFFNLMKDLLTRFQSWLEAILSIFKGG